MSIIKTNKNEEPEGATEIFDKRRWIHPNNIDKFCKAHGLKPGDLSRLIIIDNPDACPKDRSGDILARKISDDIEGIISATGKDIAALPYGEREKIAAHIISKMMDLVLEQGGISAHETIMLTKVIKKTIFEET